MDANNVQKSIIVQPSNYMYDHTYVLHVLEQHPTRFNLVMLLNPTLPPQDAVAQVVQLAKQGCTGIRFNPSLWPKNIEMDDELGKAVFQVAEELKLTISFMCFTGFPSCAGAITRLAALYPHVDLVVDHFGFPRTDPGSAPNGQSFDDDSFNLLMKIGKSTPRLNIKISALFRVSSSLVVDDNYSDLLPRFLQLVDVFGSERLLWGSDFPYVELHQGYGHTLKTIQDWVIKAGLSDDVYSGVMGRNAKRLFVR